MPFARAGLGGRAATSNILLLGFAFQAGLVPLSAAAIENAIRINNAAVPKNLAAFQWGRLLAHDQGRVLGPASGASPVFPADETLDALVERRAELLTRYQDARYALRAALPCARPAREGCGGDCFGSAWAAVEGGRDLGIQAHGL